MLTWGSMCTDKQCHHHEVQNSNVVNGGRSSQLMQNCHACTKEVMSMRKWLHMCNPYMERISVAIEPDVVGNPSTSVRQVNRFGGIPKKHRPGFCCLITLSVNDATDPALHSQDYITLVSSSNTARSWILGWHIKTVYRLILSHPNDRIMLGMQWNGYPICRQYIALCPSLGTKNTLMQWWML